MTKLWTCCKKNNSIVVSNLEKKQDQKFNNFAVQKTTVHWTTKKPSAGEHYYLKQLFTYVYYRSQTSSSSGRNFIDIVQGCTGHKVVHTLRCCISNMKFLLFRPPLHTACLKFNYRLAKYHRHQWKAPRPTLHKTHLQTLPRPHHGGGGARVLLLRLLLPAQKERQQVSTHVTCTDGREGSMEEDYKKGVRIGTDGCKSKKEKKNIDGGWYAQPLTYM